MPVVIKDFSVETEGPGGSGAPSQPPSVQEQPQAQARSQGVRQVVELLKAAQQRVCRLHAD
jgi:hypothetical protein